MGVMRPRPPASQGLRAANTARDKDLEQFRRSLTAPKAAAPAKGGGVTGVTRLTAGGIVQANNAAPVGSGVTFSDYTIAALFGDAVSVTEGSDGQITFGTAGFYMAHAHVRLGWSGGATVDEVRASADFESADPYPLWFRKLGTADGHGGTPSLRDSFAWGPFFVDAGGWTSFALNWQTSDAAYLSAMALDVWRVG